jgi:UDP-glucose 4,6-dehydratase
MIALYGATGYIGSEFVKELNRRGLKHCKISHRDALWFADADLVINCAAFVTKPSVDLCEDHKSECLLGNVWFPAVISTTCSIKDIPLIHVSTGCLYNGDNGGRGWSESDASRLTFDTGAGFYVGSKELAERGVLLNHKTYCCRIRLPFDNEDNPRNYLTKLLTYEKLVLANNSISHRGDFVKACLDLWQKGAPYGIYNVTNPGFVNTAQVCREMIRAGMMEKEKPYWAIDEFQEMARTLKSNCVHNVSKLLSTGVKIRPVQEAITDAIQTWKKA